MTSMKFRTKPIIVEAWQWLGQPREEWPSWVKEVSHERHAYKHSEKPYMQTDDYNGPVPRHGWLVLYPDTSVRVFSSLEYFERIEDGKD